MNSVCGSIFSCCKDPEESDASVLNPSYLFKKAVATVAFFTDGPTSWAAVGQTINEHVLPFFAELADGADQLKKISEPFSTAFKVVDLGEHVNDLHYFLNGDAYKDLIHFRVASIAYHVLQIPIHWINTSVFLTALDLAAVIGEARIFAWAKQAGAFLQSLPVLKSIPHIAEVGNKLSQVQVFKWIPALTAYAPLAEGAGVAVTGLQLADALQRYWVSKQKASKLEDEYLDYLVHKHKFTKGQIDSLATTHKVSSIAKLSFADMNQVDPLHPKIRINNQVGLGRLKVKLLNQQNKKFRATVDGVAAAAQAVFQVALLAGLTQASIIFALAACAVTALGASLYFRATLKKPDLAEQLL